MSTHPHAVVTFPLLKMFAHHNARKPGRVDTVFVPTRKGSMSKRVYGMKWNRGHDGGDESGRRHEPVKPFSAF